MPGSFNEPRNPVTISSVMPYVIGIFLGIVIIVVSTVLIAVASQGKKNGTKNRGVLKAIGIILLIIAIVGGVVFIGKCAYKKFVDSDINTDGNPVFLNRGATTEDISLEQSFEATITNLKDSYKVTPNVDIKGLKITFKFFDKSGNMVSTFVSELGDVTKSQAYTISVSHSFSDILKITTYQYYVSAGTVSYFA